MSEMETFRKKRSQVRVSEKSRSDSYRNTGERVLQEGSKRIQKRRALLNSASDLSSSSYDTTKEDSIIFEVPQGSSGRAAGIPMKRLLSEEMLKETESKRTSPSVIARLMGLEGLPPPQPVHNHQARLVESSLQKSASVPSQRNNKLYGGRSRRMSSKEQQEFKDVFEVVETSKVESNSKLAEAKMAFIRQKFMDAKRLSTDEKLHSSKEFHDALEVLDSNKDLFLKFLQEPDSLFTKHLQDLQGASPQSHCSDQPITRILTASKYENTCIGWKSERETSRKIDTNSHQRNDNRLLTHPYSKHGAPHHQRSSKAKSENRDETHVLPTRIVVLKPNLAMVHPASKSLSSLHSSHASLSQSRNSELERLKTREIAREITREMRHSFGNESMIMLTSGKGYAGDESSGNISENDSTNEYETSPSSRIELKKRYRPPSPSHLSKSSSVTKEAKKRLSERWKVSQRSQEVGLTSRGSTLGEMLAVPDREARAEKQHLVVGQNDPSDGSSPLGISSKDAMKNVCIKNLSRSRSLPSSLNVLESPKRSNRRGVLVDEWYLVQKDGSTCGKNKAAKENFSQREDTHSRNLRCIKRDSQSPLWTNRESAGTVLEIQPSETKMRNRLQGKECSAGKPVGCEPSSTHEKDDELADAKHRKKAMDWSSKSLSGQLDDRSLCSLQTVESFTHHVGDSSQQCQTSSIGPSEESPVPLYCPCPEPESPAASKDGDQPSPVSVLEPPFAEDLSSGSECFESLSADLHGLRMQLKLLKLESNTEAYSEGPMLVSSDEEHVEEKGELADNPQAKEGRDFSYVSDVLNNSGLDSSDPNTFRATLHSPECPVGLSVFETLEKKYCNQLTWSTSERRLLFDRTNSGLLDITERFIDSHPWLKPTSRLRFTAKWHKETLEVELRKLLASQVEANKHREDEIFERESKWVQFEDDIDDIGSEIGRLITDELLTEVVAMFGV